MLRTKVGSTNGDHVGPERRTRSPRSRQHHVFLGVLFPHVVPKKTGYQPPRCAARVHPLVERSQPLSRQYHPIDAHRQHGQGGTSLVRDPRCFRNCRFTMSVCLSILSFPRDSRCSRNCRFRVSFCLSFSSSTTDSRCSRNWRFRMSFCLSFSSSTTDSRCFRNWRFRISFFAHISSSCSISRCW